MPAVEEAPVQRMTLASFDGPGAPPDDYVQPPSKGGEGAPAKNDAPAKNVITEPPIAPIVDDDELPTPESDPDKPAKPDPDEPERTLADSMDDPVVTAKQDAAKKRADDEKAAKEAAAASAQTEDEKKKAADVAATAKRDDDLKYEAGAHTHPKTRTVITKFQAAAKAARDERDAVIAERESLRKANEEMATKAKTGPAPKELEDEVKSLRERVRELDISKDPILEKKYDQRITANNQSIVDTLKAQGYGMVKSEDGKMVENPKAIAELVKGGLTMKNLNPLIKKLEEAELIDEADAIREAVRANNRLAQEKHQEVESWKGDYSKRQQERETITKQQREQQGQAFRERTDTILKADLETLAKDFSYINRPPEPLATDIPATVKAKHAAISEYDAAAKAIETAVKGLNTEGLTPDKLPDAVGRINANAIKAIVLEKQVLPRVKAELAAKTARIAELEKELNSIRDAGKLSRLHSSSSNEPGFNGKSEPKSLEEAFQAPGA